MKLIETKNLDFATVLLTHGIEHKKIKKYSDISAGFFFENTKEYQKLHEDFFEGNIKENIAVYSRNRQYLKHEARNLPVYLAKHRREQFVVAIGSSYWYHGPNNSACHALYADKQPHVDRVNSGQVFRTKQECEQYISSL